ncbi:MAG: lysophospholipid acyltransferase family protein [Thermoanaerobaculia bacterium]
MGFVRSLGIWAVIAGATIVLGIPAIPLALLPPRGEWALRIARLWSRIILAASGVRVRVLHADRLPNKGSFVVAPNHESFYDILVLFAAVPLSLRFLAKRNLFRLPILGWAIAAAGFVPVDRGDRGRSPATIDVALKRLAGGRSLIVFPEETRTRTGELLAFKAGAALLAIHAGLPLLPLGLAGTFRIQRRGGFTITPSEVAMAVGAPIDVSDSTPRDRAAVTQRLREEIASLRDEARAAVAYNPESEAR